MATSVNSSTLSKSTLVKLCAGCICYNTTTELRSRLCSTAKCHAIHSTAVNITSYTTNITTYIVLTICRLNKHNCCCTINRCININCLKCSIKCHTNERTNVDVRRGNLAILNSDILQSCTLCIAKQTTRNSCGIVNSNTRNSIVTTVINTLKWLSCDVRHWCFCSVIGIVYIATNWSDSYTCHIDICYLTVVIVCISCIASTSREQLKISSSANQIWICCRTVTTTPLARDLTTRSGIVQVDIEVIVGVTSKLLIISIGIDCLVGCNLNSSSIVTWSKHHIECLCLSLSCTNCIWSSQSCSYTTLIATSKGKARLCTTICKVCSKLTSDRA